MKIAYFITGLGLGGAEVVTIELANLMARRGHSVTLIYLNGENMHTDRIDPLIRTYQLNMRKTPVGLCRSLSKARHIPVSYTHLDVYKRQKQNRKKEISAPATRSIWTD